MILTSASFTMINNAEIGWSTNPAGVPRDTLLKRAAAGIMAVMGSSGAGAAIEGVEMTAPAAPAANAGRTFYQDNGSGATQYCVRFNTGSIIPLATEGV